MRTRPDNWKLICDGLKTSAMHSEFMHWKKGRVYMAILKKNVTPLNPTLWTRNVKKENVTTDGTH